MQPIDIRPDHLRLVLDILQQHVPMAEVWAFGSRAKWLARDTSDLDLCIRDAIPLSFEQMGLLREAFEESNLPYKVDVVDWATISASFRKVVERDKVVVQKAKTGRVMAGEWRRTTLDQLGRIITGKTPPSSHSSAFGGAIPFVTPSDMDGRRAIRHTARNLTESGAAVVRGARVPASAVMVSCIGSDMGKAAIAGIDCVTNQQINSIIIETEDLPLYVYYDLSTRKAEIRGAASGSAQPILNKSAFGRFKIELPPPDEQRVIAHILGTLDDKIELNRRMNETLEAIARAIFKSWFVDFDPVRAKASGEPPESICRRLGLTPDLLTLFPDRLVDSELGEIPEGWKIGTLGDVAEHPRRGIQPAGIAATSPYIALEHMPRRCIALSDWDMADGLESNKFQFRKGEILFGKLRPYFHKVGVAPVDGVCSTDIVVMTPKGEGWFGFVLGHVSSDAFVEHTNAGSTGTKMPRTSWNDMARFQIVIPSDALSDAYTGLFRPMVDRIAASIYEGRTLAALRDTLLPKLLSGELRVPEAESMKEELLV